MVDSLTYVHHMVVQHPPKGTAARRELELAALISLSDPREKDHNSSSFNILRQSKRKRIVM